MRWSVVLVALASVQSACVQSDEVACSDGRVCPSGNTCDDVGHRCISPEQIAACIGLAEDTACTTTSFTGECTAGACQPYVCGDGLRTGDELCDGSDLGGATCLDAGFYAPDGLACTASCTFDTSACVGTCGDGIVNGDEMCDVQPPPGTCVDDGFDAGALACSSSCSGSFASCARFGWRPELTQLSNLADLSGLAANDLWTAGTLGSNDGQIGHFDGVSWVVAAPVPGLVLQTVAEAAPGDVWAVGFPVRNGPTTLVHLVGGVATPVSDLPSTRPEGIRAFAADDVYVATGDAGVQRWDGASWHAVGTLTTPLVAISGIADSDLWAVGSNGSLARWNGAAWSPSSTGSIAIQKVDPIASDDAWAIGGATSQLGSPGVVMHWDGVSWSLSLSLSVGGQQLRSLIAIANNDVWVSSAGGAAYHFDGDRWTSTVTTVGATGSSGGFGAMAKVPGAIVGITFDGYTYRYTGQVYGALDVDLNASSSPQLNAVWTDRSDDTYVGDNGGDVEHFDGQDWEVAFTTPGSDAIEVLGGTDPSNVWASAYSGNAYRYDGHTWTQMFQTTTPRAIWGTGPSDMWFAGANVSHWDGAALTTMLSGAMSYCCVTGTSSMDVWVPEQGSGDVINLEHWDGSQWTLVPGPPPTTDTVAGIVATGANDVFGIAGNHIDHYDGNGWTETIVPVTSPLQAIAGSAHDDVFALSFAGELFHFDGAQWTPVQSPSVTNLSQPSAVGLSVLPGVVDVIYRQQFGDQPVRRLIRTRPWNCRAHETNCSDGVDDDCDGLVDGDDPDCQP